MKTVLLRFAAVCGVVCVLILSTTQCAKQEEPQPQDLAAHSDSIAGGPDTSAFVTDSQAGGMRMGTLMIDLTKYTVNGSTLDTTVHATDVGSMIGPGDTVSVFSIRPIGANPPWPGSQSGTAIAEQSTKVTITTSDVEIPPTPKKP